MTTRRTHRTPASAAGRVGERGCRSSRRLRDSSLRTRPVSTSRLSNEANLRGVGSGWLVFGVSNSRQIVGTTHLVDGLQRQLQAPHPSVDLTRATIREVYAEVTIDGERVVLLEVPAAPRCTPISWKGDCRARAGESLVPLSLDKLDEIRRQTIGADWTAVVVPEATLAHLDPAAIARARQGFTERYSPDLASDVAAWDDATSFLEGEVDSRRRDHAGGASAPRRRHVQFHLLTPHPAQMTCEDRPQ